MSKDSNKYELLDLNREFYILPSIYISYINERRLCLVENEKEILITEKPVRNFEIRDEIKKDKLVYNLFVIYE